MKTTIALIEDKSHEIAEELLDAYVNQPSEVNTDVILEKDGTVRSHNYFGSIDYRGDDIAVIFHVSNSTKVDYKNSLLEGLTEAQRQFCYEKGYISIWMTDSENPEDWNEYTPSWDDFIDEVHQKINQIKNDPMYA
jgi:hypothetical protein